MGAARRAAAAAHASCEAMAEDARLKPHVRWSVHPVRLAPRQRHGSAAGAALQGRRSRTRCAAAGAAEQFGCAPWGERAAQHARRGAALWPSGPSSMFRHSGASPLTAGMCSTSRRPRLAPQTRPQSAARGFRLVKRPVTPRGPQRPPRAHAALHSHSYFLSPQTRLICQFASRRAR